MVFIFEVTEVKEALEIFNKKSEENKNIVVQTDFTDLVNLCFE